MVNVFVIDTNRKVGNPCPPAVARKLLSKGKAAVFRQYPFTIILKEESHDRPKPLRLNIDPGSKTTGMALVDDATGNVHFMVEIEHKSLDNSKAMTARRSLRRSRRSRKTRYRKPRFNNRTSQHLPPSIESRIAQIETWIKRFIKFSPVTEISIELAKFDSSLLPSEWKTQNYLVLSINKESS